MSKYANPLLDKIDPKRLISHRLFREHCTFSGNAFVKDLAQIGRDLKDTIIIDNSSASYAFQPSNAMPIKTWIDDKSDTQLYDYLPILEALSKVSDVREYLRKIVKNDQINCVQALKLLKAEFEPQKPIGLEPRTTLINSWMPQQGRVITQASERTQQSQMSLSRYTQATEGTSKIPYRTTRDGFELLNSPATTRYDPGKPLYDSSRIESSGPTLLANRNVRKSVETKVERKNSLTESARKVPATPSLRDPQPARPIGTFLAQPATTKSQYLQRDQYGLLARGTPTRASRDAQVTPVRATTRGSGRNISEEKTPNPNPTKPALYYTNLLRTKVETDSGVEKSFHKNDSKARLTYSASANKRLTSSYSVDNKGKEQDKSGTKPSEGNSNISLLNVRKSAQLSSHINTTTKGYTINNYEPRTTSATAMAAKTASSGFYAWAPEKRLATSTKNGPTATVLREQSSLQYLYPREKESLGYSGSRANLISRTGAVYPTYASTSRSGWSKHYNY